MKIKNKKIITALLLIFCCLAMFRTGCVESVTDTGGTSGSTAPTIEIASPVTGDTVYVGQNEITYTATDPSSSGLSQYEVFINGTSANVYEVGTSTTKIKIYLDIPETHLYQKISYYVLVYSKSGKYKKSVEQKNLYVKPTPPKAPGKLRIGKENDFKFNLSWIDSSDNENRFELWRKDGASGTYKRIKDLTENQFFTDDVVPSAYVIYFYKIRAGHATGVSAFSNEVNTLIAPSNLQAKTPAVTTVELTWNDNSSFENGFRIERSAAVGGEFEWIGTVATNITTYKDESVLSATSYIYRVAAFTGNASSPYSNEVTITTPTADTPPTQLKADFNTTTRKVDITWYSPNYNMTTYIERKNGYSGQYTVIKELSNLLLKKYSDSLVSADVYYFYRVRELTYTGLYTAYSNEDSAYVPLLPPLAPSNLSILAASSSASNLGYILSWQDNSGDEDGFELWRKDGIVGDENYHLVYTFERNWHAATVSVPVAGVVYSFKLRSVRNGMGSAFSNEVYTSSPWGLTLLSVSKDYVSLRWNDNYTNEVYFSLERKLEWQDDTYYEEVGTNPAQNGMGVISYTDRKDLSPGVKYNYRVRAVFNQGYSGYSNVLTVTTSVL